MDFSLGFLAETSEMPFKRLSRDHHLHNVIDHGAVQGCSRPTAAVCLQLR